MAETRTEIATLDDALAAVAVVGLVAREHAQKAEDMRTLPPEVVDAITDAGLWGVFTSTTLGGSGLIGLNEEFEIIRAMAYEDASAGWALLICAATPALLGAVLTPKGQAEVFADGIVPMAGVFNPAGTAAPVDGGFRVSGKWPFGSGVSYAGWVMGNALLLDESGAPKPGVGGLPELLAVVVPRDSVTIVDDWHVAGLRGTGSMSFTMDGVVVPEHRTFSFFGTRSTDEPKYRLPLFSLIAPLFAGMAVGLAQRAVDEVTALLPTRVGPPNFQPASENPINQVSLGQAMATVRAALEAGHSLFGRYDDRTERGEDLSALPIAERAEIHQYAAWTAAVCSGVVNDLFRLGGANSIYEPGVLQRTWRDINVFAQHLYLRSTFHEIGGKVALGIEIDSPFV